MIKTEPGRGAIIVVGVAGLLIMLFLQLAMSVRRESQTWNEGNQYLCGIPVVKLCL
ncbi:MAG: hypothetical protein JWM21_4909 [Acidobacteria bacterium]|nr:hypothetical protein [Acidobacteriota bacterium]